MAFPGQPSSASERFERPHRSRARATSAAIPSAMARGGETVSASAGSRRWLVAVSAGGWSDAAVRPC
jgi:hypothetical protein